MSSIVERQFLPKLGDLKPHTLPRRSFLRRLGLGAAALVPGAALLNATSEAFGDESENGITEGDAAMLRFAAAAEILETDFWVQYNELGGIVDAEVPGGTPIPAYVGDLQMLDSDMPQYIHDNTEDEFTHFTFLNAYLESKGARPANLDKFRTLPGSSATGSSGKLRLTNLTQLTLDTSWWTRYRSRTKNPDLDPNFVFPQAIPSLHTGQHTAIPRTNADLVEPFLQAIANTAGFHFPTIEQGGNSLYPSMAQRATSVEVLRILISIGPTETMHFQTWSDKAGNAPQLTNVMDPVTGVSVTFPDLNSPPFPPGFGKEDFQTNLIMPEPCPFISKHLPVCSIIRPTNTHGVAMGAVKFLTDMGLFIGQPPAFFNLLKELAEEADQAERED